MSANETLYWCENSFGYVFLTSIMSTIPEGFIRCSTTIPSEMDKIFAKLDKQERAKYAKMTHDAYERRKEFIEHNLSDLRTRLANSTNNFERGIIRAWIEAFNKRQSRLQECTVYGVSEMQQREAPLPGPSRKIILTDESESV